ncbi:MAG: hypothetical protein ACMG6E_02565 [Candidatus Roizmanbacteria bacterium]
MKQQKQEQSARDRKSRVKQEEWILAGDKSRKDEQEEESKTEVIDIKESDNKSQHNKYTGYYVR